MPNRLYRTLCLVGLLGVVLTCTGPMPAARCQAPARPRGAAPASPQVTAILQRAADAGNAGRHRKALEAGREALAVAQRLGDRPGEVRALLCVVWALANGGRHTESLRFAKAAVAAARSAGDRALEGRTLAELGERLACTGRPAEGVALIKEGLDVARATGDGRVVLGELQGLATAFFALGRDQEANDSLRQAVALCLGSGDLRGALTTLDRLRGRTAEDVELAAEVLQAARAAGDAATVELAQMAMAGAFRDAGEYARALALYQRLLRASVEKRDTAQQRSILNALDLLYFSAGHPERALAYAQAAYELAKQRGDDLRDPQVLNGLGYFSFLCGHHARALVFLRRALALARAVRNATIEADILVGIADVHTATGSTSQAEWCYRTALDLALRHSDDFHQAYALNGLGMLSIARGRASAALTPCTRAVAIYRRIYNTVEMPRALANLAAALQARGRLGEAARLLAEAVRMRESVRTGLGGMAEARSRVLSTGLAVYHQTIALNLLRKDTVAAFEAAQLAKARGLLDALGSQSPVRAAAEPADLMRLKRLRAQADALNRDAIALARLGGRDAQARRAALRARLARVEAQIGELEDVGRAGHALSGLGPAGRPVRLAQVAGFLPADTALLEYAVLQAGEGRPWLDRTVLFVVTVEHGRPRVTAHDIRVSSKGLTRLVSRLRTACADRRGPWAGPASDLYARLIAPAARRIAGKRRLVLCPDGPLWNVPFAALVARGAGDARPAYLIERHELAYAHSASGLRAVLAIPARRPERGSGSVLVVADPDFGERRPAEIASTRMARGAEGREPASASASPAVDGRQYAADLCIPRGAALRRLPGAAREARAICVRFPAAAVLTGASAQEDTVKREAGRYRVLHFATHGFVNDASPLLSCLALATPAPGSDEDGFLTAREILELRLSAELAVLSACNTARGEIRRGEGVVGMTWALAAAGVRAQVPAQWAVDDASTEALMRGFYGRLKSGASRGAALRSASLALLRDRRTSHPHHWAPFILVGDWR